MSFLHRLKMGWNLSVDSLSVVRSEPRLALFPLIAGIAGAVYISLILIGTVLLAGTEPGAIAYAALFVAYLGSAFIAAFFSAALMSNARALFDGDSPTLVDGIHAAWSKRRQLAVWSVISAMVGVIFTALESEDVPFGDIASVLFSAAWGIMTYFVVPVILFEKVTVSEMFKRSGQTFKRTWGETAGASFGVGIITALFALAGLSLAGTLFLVIETTGMGLVVSIGLAGIVVLSAVLLGSALSSISKTALYVYATEGRNPAGFENIDFSAVPR